MAKYSSTNLIVNYLPQKLSDDDFRSLFTRLAPVKRAKICRDKRTGYSFGFGFCEFYRPEDATKAIEELNGYQVQQKTLKVAYARLQSSESKNCCLHLTNLPTWVTAANIRGVFQNYGGIINCKILYGPSGTSKGIGFCLFETHSAAAAAMDSVNQKPWPSTTEPLVSIRFAHPNEKKVRAPPYPGAKFEQSPAAVQQSSHSVGHLGQQPAPMWNGCYGYQQMAPYPPMMRGLSYSVAPTNSVLHTHMAPSPVLMPPAYFEFHVCATNLCPRLDDLQLYGLFAPFGGIVLFYVVRPDAVGSPSNSNELEASISQGESHDGDQQQQGQQQDLKQESQQQQQKQQLQVQTEQGTPVATATAYVTFNNYQSAASAVVSLNGQMLNGQVMEVAFRQDQQAPMQDGGDSGMVANMTAGYNVV